MALVLDGGMLYRRLREGHVNDIIVLRGNLHQVGSVRLVQYNGILCACNIYRESLFQCAMRHGRGFALVAVNNAQGTFTYITT